MLTSVSGYWRQVALDRVVLDGGDPMLATPLPTLTEGAADAEMITDDVRCRWKRLACLSTSILVELANGLLANVHGAALLPSSKAAHNSFLTAPICCVGCSSYDQPCESPVNTLLPSQCWKTIHKLQTCAPFDQRQFEDPTDASEALRCLFESAQAECGCNTSPTSCCYWSSMPSLTPVADDFIEYAVLDNSLVERMQIVPYRAFRLPGSPAFAPERVSFEFFRREQRDVVSVYNSPVYLMENDMTLQEFVLPKMVMLYRGGLIRVNFVGRYQRERTQISPWLLHHDIHHNNFRRADDFMSDDEQQYFICLSYVNALGVPNAV